MSTANDVYLEFRCSRCYQSLYESVEAVGKTVQCPYCNTANDVPEATADRLQRAAEIDPAALREPEEVGLFADKQLTPEEIAAESKRRVTAAMSQRQGYLSVAEQSCARFKRLLAVIIDAVIMVLVYVLNFLLGSFLAAQGFFTMPTIDELAAGITNLELSQFLALFGLGFCLQIVFWVLIATRGQTPGKMLLGIKIVDEQGNPPGFFQGVFLRQWVMGGISSVVPIVGLVDCLMIFRDPPRCWHDQMASTYVVNVKRQL